MSGKLRDREKGFIGWRFVDFGVEEPERRGVSWVIDIGDIISTAEAGLEAT